MEIPELKYTICFCIDRINETVLMHHRAKSPNKNKWNGVGGKIELGETHRESVIREVWEETGIDLKNKKLIYCGVIAWKVYIDTKLDHHGGMHAYVAYFQNLKFEDLKRNDGFFSLKKLDWILDIDNKEVVDNIPHFLPNLLSGTTPKLYECVYQDLTLSEFNIKKLPLEF